VDQRRNLQGDPARAELHESALCSPTELNESSRLTRDTMSRTCWRLSDRRWNPGSRKLLMNSRTINASRPTPVDQMASPKRATIALTATDDCMEAPMARIVPRMPAIGYASIMVRVMLYAV